MKEIRTTFYDLRGYFIPGSILLWVVIELLGLSGGESSQVINSFSPAVKVLFFIVVSYVIGHALHATANFTIDKLPFSSQPPKNYFERKFAEDFQEPAAELLYNSITGLFGKADAQQEDARVTIKKSYWLCLQYCLNRQNVETENFLGLTGFYRGVTMSLLTIAALYFWMAFKLSDCTKGMIGLGALLLAGLFLTRVKRFNYYLTRTVYSNFLHLTAERKPDTAA